jgi:hypothetical protein
LLVESSLAIGVNGWDRLYVAIERPASEGGPYRVF